MLNPLMAVSPLLDDSAPKDDDIPRVQIACSNVCHSVRVRVGCCKALPKQILTNISCDFQPGTLTALMGPSGAGKTTLLSLLRSGRPSSGEVTLNGQPHGRSRGLIRTIPQDDVLLAGLTAAESLHFAAQLSLPRAACAARVAAVLKQLSLGPDLAHTKIGSVHARGLSGGQRKRVSIGIELLADPAVLLVDEPTSGLDAKMAQDVMAMLKSLSLSGRTIVSTVHQPSHRIFCLFDALVLLSDGRLAYSGDAAAAVGYFAARGFATPVHENPAEYMISILDEPAEGGASLTDLWAAGGDAAASASAFVSVAAAAAEAPPPPTGAAAGDGAPRRLRFVSSTANQVTVLLRRELYDQVKDTRKLVQTLSMRIGVGLLVGILFYGQGRRDEFTSIFPVTSAMFIALFNSNLDTTMETLLKAPAARALLRREWLNGLYSTEAYFTAIMVANTVLAALNTLALVLPLYLLVGFSTSLERAAVFFGALAIMTVIGMCNGIAIGCASSDMDEARKMLMPIIAPQMIFSGYVLPYNDLPVYFKPFYYLSFWQYGLGILQLNEFSEHEYSRGCPNVTVEDACYEGALALLGHQAQQHNFTLNLTQADAAFGFPFNGTCSGKRSLEVTGLWPPKFGGIGGYFLILGAYALVFMLAAYVALKVSLRKAARG